MWISTDLCSRTMLPVSFPAGRVLVPLEACRIPEGRRASGPGLTLFEPGASSARGVSGCPDLGCQAERLLRGGRGGGASLAGWRLVLVSSPPGRAFTPLILIPYLTVLFLFLMGDKGCNIVQDQKISNAVHSLSLALSNSCRARCDAQCSIIMQHHGARRGSWRYPKTCWWPPCRWHPPRDGQASLQGPHSPVVG